MKRKTKTKTRTDADTYRRTRTRGKPTRAQYRRWCRQMIKRLWEIGAGPFARLDARFWAAWFEKRMEQAGERKVKR